MADTKRVVVQDAEDILDCYFPALDHGFVALTDYMGGDHSVERTARVSYGAGTRKVSKTRELLRYLVRERHTSPLECVKLQFHMCLPIVVARQLVRHRMQSINEASARYSLMPLQFYAPQLQVFGEQSKDNKQGRSPISVDADIYDEWARARRPSLLDKIKETYSWLVQKNVARELARIDMPLSTYTEWYTTIDLHNLLHLLSLRCDPHAQFETRVYANIMAGVAKRVAPLCFGAWVDYVFSGTRMSGQEMEILRQALAGSQSLEDIRKSITEAGVTPREVRDFMTKLSETPGTPPFVELDPKNSMTPEEAQAFRAAAVPIVDQDEN